MSFTELKITELKSVAESFGVDISEVKTKQEIIALIEEEGISYQMYEKFSNAEKQDIEIPEIEKKKREKVLKSSDQTLLVKMERNNHSYSVGGYTFTQEHPFIAMSESEAQQIFDTQIGFRLATPREAQEYYG